MNDANTNVILYSFCLTLVNRAANHIWDTAYQLPGVSDDDHEVVQATLRVAIVRLSDELVLFCRSLVHDLTSKGYIRSRDTKSRSQDALLVLFQQA
jgi:hypothetical protein